MPTDIMVWQKAQKLRSSLNLIHRPTLKVWEFWCSHKLYDSILFIHFNSKCQNKRLYNKSRPSSGSLVKYLISPSRTGLWSISLDCFLHYKTGCGIIHQNILLFPVIRVSLLRYKWFCSSSPAVNSILVQPSIIFMDHLGAGLFQLF